MILYMEGVTIDLKIPHLVWRRRLKLLQLIWYVVKHFISKSDFY